MKFLHLADLHLGKRVNGFSMLEDQAYILRQILTILDDERPDGVLIAGDVYDKPVPPTEAVELLDGFLTELCARGVPVLLISGNSSAENGSTPLERIKAAFYRVPAHGRYLLSYNVYVPEIKADSGRARRRKKTTKK